MTGIEIAATAVIFASGGASISCVINAYRPPRAMLDDIARTGAALLASQPDAQSEDIPHDMSALLAEIDRRPGE